ncbi:MAG: hypothetical protein NTV14_04405 [Coprothermobacterota bacterium]|nr:hypothetical protein [Coprothermobacterota bacterium]
MKPVPTKAGLAAVGIAALDVAKPVEALNAPATRPSLRQLDSLRQHVLLG